MLLVLLLLLLKLVVLVQLGSERSEICRQGGRLGLCVDIVPLAL
jgi:hypothetical protein